MKTLEQITLELMSRNCTINNLNPGDVGYESAVSEWARNIYEDLMSERVPQTVTRRQLFLSLLALDEPITRSRIISIIGDNESALIEFEEALSFERSHPLVTLLASALNLTDRDVDDIFVYAGTL